ncbi:MAG TPA: S24 family peptidase [Rhizobium sp.]|nr:S24 family peptidase [Rhizobium sp.]
MGQWAKVKEQTHQMGRKSAPVRAGTLGARLRAFRGKNSIAAMGAVLGFNQSYVGKIERNEAPVTPAFIQEFMRAFPRVDIRWLLEGVGDAPPSPEFAPELEEDLATPKVPFDAVMKVNPAAPQVSIPVGHTQLGKARTVVRHEARCFLYAGSRVGAGTTFYPGDHHPTGELSLPAPPFKLQHVYAMVEVAGDSMVPVIHPGDMLLIDNSLRDVDRLVNRLCVANLRDSQGEGAVVKILKKAKGKNAGYELHSCADGHDPITHVEPSQIVGAVIAIFPG